MYEEHESKTVAVKSCHSCSGQLLESDRFCRWCGERQHAMVGSVRECQAGSDKLSTTVLGDSIAVRRAVSGPLLDAVVGTVVRTSPLEGVGARSLTMRTAIAALVSIPLWLMIVLLSPLDAFAAARTVSRQG